MSTDEHTDDEPIRLNTLSPEGIGLAWSSDFRRYLSAHVPARERELLVKRYAYVNLWHTRPADRARLASIPSIGGRKVSAADVVQALTNVYTGAAEYRATAEALGHTVTWLARRERHIRRLLTEEYYRLGIH